MAKTNRSKGAGTVFKRGKYYYLQYMINGAVKKLSLKCTGRREAEQKALELLPALEAKTKEQIALHVAEARSLTKRSSLKLENVWKLYLKSPARPDSSEGTLGNYKRNWVLFTSWLMAIRPDINLFADISAEIAHDYADFLWTGKKKKIAATTFNYHIHSLTLITKVLKDKAGIDSNPWGTITHKTEFKQKRKEFTYSQTTEIFEAFDDDKLRLMNKQEMKILFYIGAFTGLRLNDAVNLKWAAINFTRNIISLIPVKTRRIQREVNIPIHPNLKNIFDEAKTWKDESDYVLPKIAARYAHNPDGVRKDSIKIIEFCGFKGRGKGRGVNRRLYGFHSFRHFFASTCADAGVPVATLSEILGDNISTLNKYYIHAQEESRLKMISALDNNANSKILPNGLSQTTAEEKLSEIQNILDNASERTDSQKLKEIANILSSKTILTA
ncbi:MAG: tyrosine-type recombinase/integrase [Victivallaceae bacterium]|nr:tyrosine-type recombinase/integrase [Victivallaceae bacterium]